MGAMTGWAFAFRPEVKVGDLVVTPYGDATVVEVAIQTDSFWTEDAESGLILEWSQDEVEEVARPDLTDTAAVERWLAVAAVVVPHLEVQTTTVRCDTAWRDAEHGCPCRHCYRVVKEISARGIQPRTEITHHPDSDACLCLSRPGSRNRDCLCLNGATKRFVP